MKIITAGVTSAMLAVGVAGSVAAYRTQAGAAEFIRPVVEKTSATAPGTAGDEARQRPHVRWADCPKGSTLEKGTCVTEVFRTVVLPAPSPTVLPSPTPQVATTSGPEDDADEQDDATDADEPDDATDADEQDEADDHGDDDADGSHDGDDHDADDADDADDGDGDDGDDHGDDGDDHGDDGDDHGDDDEVEDED